MISFAADYFIMVFVASLGVIQAAASIGGLRGLLVFKHPRIARALGVALAIGAIVWFFAAAERNINDYEGGLDSNQQGILFFLAVAAAGMLTCALTSPLNKRLRHNRDAPNADDARCAVDARRSEITRGAGKAMQTADTSDYGTDTRQSSDTRRVGNAPYAVADVKQACDTRQADDAPVAATNAPPPGLGALRYSSWWQAMTQNYRYWYRDARCWRTQIKRYFSG